MNSAKTLNLMPDSVRGSAWINRREVSLVARVACAVEEKLLVTCAILVAFSWWTVAYWLLVWAFPVYWLERSVPSVRQFIVASYACTFALLLFTHWLGIQTAVPRAEKGWPALGDSVATDSFKPLAMSLLCFSALLFGAVVLKTHGAVTEKEHLLTAIEVGTLGLLCTWLYWRPLKYGYSVPSESEVMADASTREAAFQRSMQPRSGTGSDQKSEDYATPIHAVKPRRTFADMFGMLQVKEKLLEPARLVLSERVADAEDPRNGILLHGEPGNGKTDFAEALAGELGVPFLQMTYGDVASKWVGEMPRVISNCFALAKRTAPCVFFIDELDSFLPSRETGSNNSEDQKITNTMLTEMVNLRRHQVVLVGATNFLAKLDTAAIRDGRFDYKVEITPPDEPARIGLLRDAAKRFGGALEFPDTDLVAIAKRWNGFSVARIRAVAKAIPDFAKTTDVKVIGYNDWVGALRTVQARTAKTPTNAKSLSELILDTSTREALVLIASRLNDAYRIEGMGGTLPNGVLFFGPSGTGKTEAARALAKASGWSFLSVAGPDLVADRSKLSAIYADARDSRPAIVFIDEADDILRSRQYSSTPDLTNILLTLMDGVDEKVKDVIIIAATNHPDDVDPALLRAGRFTEKVGFQPPQEDQVPRFIAAWLKDKRAGLEAGLDAFDMGSMCSGQTIANIQGALQYALNRAIHRHIGEGTVMISREDFRSALAVVMGETET